jgi:Kef-type K+ transport system membrane component KefB
MKKHWLLYLVALVIFGAGIAWILNYGSRLNNPPTSIDNSAVVRPIPSPPAKSDSSENALARIGRVLRENLQSPLSILLVQIIVIIIAAKLFGRIFHKIRQPAVIGEMVAGILLGPSLLGWLSPPTMTFLFPDASLGTLRLLSQLGVIIFMFTVGMELSLHHLREKAQAAVVISHASIVVPFFLGVALSLGIYRQFAPPHSSFVAFALFIGIAMSITAFPVLARILEERGLSQSYIGTMAIACAAVDDVTAWCLLAIVVAVSNAAGLNASLAPILLSLVFISVMVFLIKPLLGRFIKQELADEKRGRLIVASIVAFVLACAWFTEIIGIHALFGGFLAGVVMPADVKFRAYLKERLETFSTAVLLPLFFAFTGLRTQVNLLGDRQSLMIGAGIVAVAIAGKLGGSMLTARWTGMSWRESFSIGALMNTRGLVELIVLNIGYDLGILPDRIFAIMVLMALITTCMTGPLLELVISKDPAIKAPARFADDELTRSQ